MLLQSLLATQIRLLRVSPTSNGVALASRKLCSNVNTFCVHFNQLRALATIDSSSRNQVVKDCESLRKNEQEGETVKPSENEMSPLERLMLDLQHFDLDDATKDKAAELMDRSRCLKRTNISQKFGTFKRNTYRRRENSESHWQLGRRAEGHVIGKDMDEIDYEAELENVWGEHELKQRKFNQALHRTKDEDQVCGNCGERGHRMKNCLIPRICSNCGNLGHTAHQCRYRKNPDSVDEFLKEEEVLKEKRRINQQLRRKAAKAAKNPSMPRPKEVPTSEFNKRNESLRAELNAELDAYADMIEAKARKRNEAVAHTKVDNHLAK